MRTLLEQHHPNTSAGGTQRSRSSCWASADDEQVTLIHPASLPE
jgi:hypothetical protein